MKLIINDNNFTEIGTAVFYSSKDINNKTFSKVQYKSNSSLLYNRDFSEYDFSFNVDKEKFNDEFLIDYVGDKTLGLFEENPSTLEKLESIIFPTLGNQDFLEKEDKYFGTSLINNQVFALFSAEKGIKRLELYRGIISNNNNLSESDFIDVDTLYSMGVEPIEVPYFTVILGESNDVIEDSDLVKKQELEDEIMYDKMIWMLITSNNKISEVNLSYKSWIDSINPNRNMNKYLIRNDEYWSTTDSINILEELEDTDNFLIDANSGTLLGTEKIDESRLLIFNKLKDRVNKFKYSEGQDYPNYFPYNTYSKGDRVYYGGQVWESMSDNNFNSTPPFSTKWILSNIIESIKSIQIIVSVTPLNGGTCDPIGIISVPSLNSIVRFKISPNAGYELSRFIPCIIDEKTQIPLDPEDYDYSVPESVIIISNWRKMLTTNKLIFNLSYIGSKIIINAKFNGEIISYDKWTTTFNESNFIIKYLITGEDDNKLVEENPYVTKDGELTITTNKRTELIIPELVSYVISSIECSWEGGNSDDLPNKIIPEILEDGSNSIVISKSDFTTGYFTFTLDVKKVSATITVFDGFEISNNSLKVNSGTAAVFKFIDSEYITLPSGEKQLADNLDKVVLTDNQGNRAEIDRFSSNGSPIVFGYSSVTLTRVDQPIGSINYGEYTLKIANLYFNTNIEILRI